ncbi:MAG TPA: hypothetical protein DIW44_00680 [Anaerolineaceae bacterium]|nr:hypothetical protein [Anaerolineaceae bacterium]
MEKTLGKLMLLFTIITLITACYPLNPSQNSANKRTTPIAYMVGQDGNNASGSGDEKTFHINFNMDEIVVCSTDVKCDAPYVPKSSAYLRGMLTTAKNGSVDGEGQIIFTDAEGCRTLDAANSSCEVKDVTDGTFKISGQVEGSTMALTLTMVETPALQVIWTTKFPTGDIVQDFSTTYQEEIKQLFINAGIIEKEFIIDVSNLGSTSSINFEGSYTFGGRRTLHGFGGLIFIPNDTAMPAVFQP